MPDKYNCKCKEGYSFRKDYGDECVKECRKYKLSCFFGFYLKLLKS